MVDLGLSPDLPAFWCYGLVVAVGGWVAGRQISVRLDAIQGVWLQWRTYLLFMLYTGLPVGLFWLLDRGGAVADTAMFGAILVGAGYQKIISGTSETIRPTSDLSPFWTPFLAYADAMAASVRQKGSDRTRRTDRQAIASIAGNDTKFKAWKDLAGRHLPDPASLAIQLAKLADTESVAGARYVRERQVRLLYGMMKSVPDRARLMRDEKLVSRWFYHFRLSSGSGLGWPAAGLAVLLGLMGMWQPDIAALEPAYYAWRAAKANTSAADQFRAREHLTALVSEEKRGAAMAQRLGLLLRDPGLPMDRVDLILRALVEPGAAGGHTPDIAGAMFAALHAGNIDTRRRVHDALQAMASACKIEILADLKAWKPTESDSDAQLEVMAARWRQAWAATTCQSA